MTLKHFCFFQISILTIIMLSMTNCVYIYIDAKEKKCVSNHRPGNSTLQIIFSISGKEEFDNLITVENPNHFEFIIIRDSYQRIIKFPIELEGKYYFCVENLSNSQITLNVLFIDEKMKNEMIPIKKIEDFIEGIGDLTTKLQRISFNIKNSAIRKKTHFNIAQDLRNKINLFAIIKIILLLITSIIEMILVTSVLNNVKVRKTVQVNVEKLPLRQSEAEQMEENL